MTNEYFFDNKTTSFINNICYQKAWNVVTVAPSAKAPGASRLLEKAKAASTRRTKQASNQLNNWHETTSKNLYTS